MTCSQCNFMLSSTMYDKQVNLCFILHGKERDGNGLKIFCGHNTPRVEHNFKVRFSGEHNVLTPTVLITRHFCVQCLTSFPRTCVTTVENTHGKFRMVQLTVFQDYFMIKRVTRLSSKLTYLNKIRRKLRNHYCKPLTIRKSVPD